MTIIETAEVRRRRNDALRRTGQGGRIVVTQGVWGRGCRFVAAAFQKVANFQDFTPDNDPYGEHDFGSFRMDRETLFWKIDIYPADPLGREAPDGVTPMRVLTLMMASEY